MEISFTDNEDWVRSVALDPSFIEISGIANETHEDETMYIYYRGNGMYIIVGEDGGDDDEMTWDHMQNFFSLHFSSLREIIVHDAQKEQEKIDEIEFDKEVVIERAVLETLNNPIVKESYNRCSYCNHYIGKQKTYCNIQCERSERKR